MRLSSAEGTTNNRLEPGSLYDIVPGQSPVSIEDRIVLIGKPVQNTRDFFGLYIGLAITRLAIVEMVSLLLLQSCYTQLTYHHPIEVIYFLLTIIS